MVFSEDSRFLLLSDKNGNRVEWINLTDESAELRKLHFDNQPMKGMRYVTTGFGSDLVAFVQDQAKASKTLVFDLHTGEHRATIAPENANDKGFPVDETVALVAYEINGSEIVTYNLETGEEISRTGGLSEGVAEPFFSPNGRTLFAYEGIGRVLGHPDHPNSIFRTWNSLSGEALGRTVFEGLVTSRYLEPAGVRWAAVDCAEGAGVSRGLSRGHGAVAVDGQEGGPDHRGAGSGVLSGPARGQHAAHPQDRRLRPGALCRAVLCRRARHARRWRGAGP